jgi:hypothetical protein
MQMLEAFHGQRFDLSQLAQEFDHVHGQQYELERQLVPAYVTTPDLAARIGGTVQFGHFG